MTKAKVDKKTVDSAVTDAKKQRKDKFGPVSAIIISVVIYFVSQIIALFGVGIYALSKGLNEDQITDLLTDSTIAQFFYFLITGVFILILLWQFLKLRGIKWSEIGLKRPAFGNFGWGILVLISYFIVLVSIISLVSHFIPSIDVEQEQEIGFEKAVGSLALVLVFLSLVIIPAVSEEILIRGFLYGGLVKKFSKIVSALIASLIFGFAHLQLGSDANPLWVAAIDTFILSMFLIWLREKTGNIYAGMFVHAMKNSIAFAALFLFK